MAVFGHVRLQHHTLPIWGRWHNKQRYYLILNYLHKGWYIIIHKNHPYMCQKYDFFDNWKCGAFTFLKCQYHICHAHFCEKLHIQRYSRNFVLMFNIIKYLFGKYCSRRVHVISNLMLNVLSGGTNPQSRARQCLDGFPLPSYGGMGNDDSENTSAWGHCAPEFCSLLQIRSVQVHFIAMLIFIYMCFCCKFVDFLHCFTALNSFRHKVVH